MAAIKKKQFAQYCRDLQTKPIIDDAPIIAKKPDK